MRGDGEQRVAVPAGGCRVLPPVKKLRRAVPVPEYKVASPIKCSSGSGMSRFCSRGCCRGRADERERERERDDGGGGGGSGGGGGGYR